MGNRHDKQAGEIRRLIQESIKKEYKNATEIALEIGVSRQTVTCYASNMVDANLLDKTAYFNEKSGKDVVYYTAKKHESNVRYYSILTNKSFRDKLKTQSEDIREERRKSLYRKGAISAGGVEFI